MIKSESLDVVGLYPESFFYGMEEYDLSYRLIEAGYSIGYDPSVTVEHKESPAVRLGDHAKLRRRSVNNTVVAWRYLPVADNRVVDLHEYIRRAARGTRPITPRLARRPEDPVHRKPPATPRRVVRVPPVSQCSAPLLTSNDAQRSGFGERRTLVIVKRLVRDV